MGITYKRAVNTVGLAVGAEVGLVSGTEVDLVSGAEVTTTDTSKIIIHDGSNEVGVTANRLDVNIPNIDVHTNAIETIEIGHSEIHNGNHYVVRNYEALAKAATRDVLIVTPNTTEWAHLVIEVETTAAPVVGTLYEATVTSANGTLDVAKNRNRNFANDNTTLIYNSPTVTSVGTMLFSSYMGGGKGIGGRARDIEEIILKQNTKYLLRMTEQNIAVTVINWVLDWYEHTSIV